MLKKISKIPFSGTPEQEEKLNAVIAECNGDKSLLMHVMQEAQLIYGYLPFEVQAMIAEGMDVPLEKVYGVSTFYAQFALSPKGRYNISVCLGTACYVKGSQAILDKISERLGIGPGECSDDACFSIEACPLHRRVRTRSRHDDQRRCLRQTHPRSDRRHSRQIPGRLTPCASCHSTFSI